MDWLEMHSPMEVHWKLKWMSFLHQNTKITLQGVQPDLTTCPPISSFDVKILQKNDDLWCVLQLYSLKLEDNIQNLPSEIAALVNKFSDLFEKPTDLPPKRPYDHSVQLIPGAQPFMLRPYRYNPAQKDEIEKQVNELLQNDMIKASVSLFASPVLLVKNKTGDWRLCVDYRRLNALTVKDKFPLPVIDEFMDELAGSKWFTSLDMRSGFHQIRMKEADQYKTAFQTHHGHFEYKVMPYGVTGDPATFQRVMNWVLAPLLRVCVIVFIDDILIYSKSWEQHL